QYRTGVEPIGRRGALAVTELLRGHRAAAARLDRLAASWALAHAVPRRVECADDAVWRRRGDAAASRSSHGRHASAIRSGVRKATVRCVTGGACFRRAYELARRWPSRQSGVDELVHHASAAALFATRAVRCAIALFARLLQVYARPLLRSGVWVRDSAVDDCVRARLGSRRRGAAARVCTSRRDRPEQFVLA